MTKQNNLTPNNVPIPTQLSYPPRFIANEEGQTVGVILAYKDFQTFLRVLAAYTDWESLPPYLQDAIDNMLADEALVEEGPSRPLRDVLKEEPS